MVKLRRILIIGVCCLLAACATGRSVRSSPTPRATVPPTATVPTEATPIAATTLWPGFMVHRFSNASGNNAALLFQGTSTPDGRYLLVKVQGLYEPGYGHDFPEQIATYDTQTGHVRVFAAARDAKHGLSGYVADATWVAWYERGLPEIGGGDWTLYVANRASGAIQQIAHQDNGQGFFPVPQLDHGMLVWAEADGPLTLDRSSVSLHLLDLATGQHRILAKAGGGASMSWPWVGWSQVTGSDGTGHEQFENLVTNEQVAVPLMAAGMVLVGTSLVLNTLGTDNPNATHFTYIPDIHQPTQNIQIVEPSPFTLNDLSFNGRYIGWNSLASHHTPEVYDVQRRQMIELPVQYQPIGTETTFVTPKVFIWNEDTHSDAEWQAAGQAHHELPIINSVLTIPAA